MKKNTRVIIFGFIAAATIAIMLVFVKYTNNKTLPATISGTTLLEHMNHKMIDSTILQTSISFEEKKIGFGAIKYGDVITHKFKFTNTGNNPLIVYNVKGSCGCTTIQSWTNNPIKPGDTGNIVIQFNSINESGLQNKKVSVFANCKPEETSIYFRVNVIN
jgi:hypothetical protein